MENTKTDEKLGMAIISTKGKLLTDDLTRGGLTDRSKKFFKILSEYVENDVSLIDVSHKNGMESMYFLKGKNGGEMVIDSALLFSSEYPPAIMTNISIEMPKEEIKSMYRKLKEFTENEKIDLTIMEGFVVFGREDTERGKVYKDKPFYESFRDEYKNIDLIPYIGKPFPSENIELYRTTMDILDGDKSLALHRYNDTLHEAWIKSDLAKENDSSYVLKGKDKDGVMTEVRLPKFEHGVSVNLETTGKYKNYLHIQTAMLKKPYSTERLFFECRKNGVLEDITLKELCAFAKVLDKEKKKKVSLEKKSLVNTNSGFADGM